MSYRYSNLFTSIEVSDISPDKTKSDRLLEVKILAWQRDREDAVSYTHLRAHET